MKALVLSSFDEGPSVLEVEDPKPGPGEVLVRVAAASINAFDVTVASGGARAFMTYEFPAVIGGDVAGTVEVLGDGVDGFAVGDRVFGMMGKGAVHDGSFGERATPTAASVAKAPDGLRDVDGGSLAVAGTTAMSAIEAVAPSDGSTVLMLGATGGVGSFALQLARGRGAHVIASVRPGDEGFVAGLGAAETVDYTGDLPAAIRERYPDGVDAAIDAVSYGDEAFGAIAGLVHAGGILVSTRGAAGEDTDLNGVRVSNANGNPAHLAALADLAVKGELKVPVRKTYLLADAAQAIADFAEQHTVGKLVITV
jgi:NADPH:quinone reductase-like Zn-dependent oxidoreductase